MPTYEYECVNCLHKLETFQKITEKPIILCPQCNLETLKRGVGGGSATLYFKGSGFYINDYKNCPTSKDENSGKGGSCGCKGTHSC